MEEPGSTPKLSNASVVLSIQHSYLPVSHDEHYAIRARMMKEGD